MNTITLWQPFASLISEGLKVFETRTWSPRSSLFGSRIVIHASKRKIPRLEWESYPLELKRVILSKWGSTFEIEFPYGALIATAVLRDVLIVTSENGDKVRVKSLSDGELSSISVDVYGDYSVGRRLWLLESVEKLVPIKCPGARGLWDSMNYYSE